MAPGTQVAPASSGAIAVERGELADQFVQRLIHALATVDEHDRGRVRAEFTARLAVLLSKA